MTGMGLASAQRPIVLLRHVTPALIRWIIVTVVLVPYFCLFTIARKLPAWLGGIRSLTRPFPGWQVLVFFWPVTLTQLYMLVFWIPLVLLDYDNYLRTIGERGTGATAVVKGSSKASKAPKGGVKHGWMTYLYSRYVEHPWVAVDLRVPHRGLLRAAEALDVHAYLRPDLPPRLGDRPTVMQGLPQRQLDQLPTDEQTRCLNDQVFTHMFQGSRRVEVCVSVLEGTGARGLRWKDSRRCSKDVRQLGCELGHQHSLDGSWHLLLSPKDALTVLTLGWGETGPAFVAQGLGPPGLVLIYAPRCEEERGVFLELLHACLCYTGQLPTTPPPHPCYYPHHAGTPVLMGSPFLGTTAVGTPQTPANSEQPHGQTSASGDCQPGQGQ